MVEIKRDKETKETVGIFVSYSNLKDTKNPKIFKLSVLIDEHWYTLFGSERELDRKLKPLQEGQRVRVWYKTHMFNGTVYRTATRIEPIDMGAETAPSISIINNLNMLDIEALIELEEWKLKELRRSV